MGHVVVVLAAGQGTRMKSPRPKVIHPVAGRPMVRWVVDAVASTKPDRTMVVVGHGAEEVAAALPPGVETCLQEEQRGTGHAVGVALAALGALDPDTPVLVVPGDTPHVTGEALSGLLSLAGEHSAEVALLTAVLDDPTGYGRVMRRSDGLVESVVEHKDATDAQRAVSEVNAGMYVFRAGTLAAALDQLRPDNAQGEYYLPDVVGYATSREMTVVAHQVDPEVVAGVNDHAQLAVADARARRRIAERWMLEGVWMQDPARVYLDADTELALGVRLYPGVHLEAGTVVEEGAVVGPEVFAVASRIGPGSRVWYSVLRHAEVGEGCDVGPYASLRPGTVLRAGAKAGTFVEMKNTTVEEGAKVPHLAYLGDATVGRSANVGAGTITCNYDGYEKHRTEIGEGAFIGSDTMLVAPVRIGDGAVTGAGSVITRDVEPGALGVERSPQKNVPGYAARRAERHRQRRQTEASDPGEG